VKLRVLVSGPLIGDRSWVADLDASAGTRSVERIDHLLKHAWRDLGAFVVADRKCQTFTVTIHAEDCEHP
jgi:hypothetical protein